MRRCAVGAGAQRLDHGAGSESVLTHLQAGGEAWLYLTDEHGVVGFGSLARSHWRWPSNKDRPRSAAAVAALPGILHLYASMRV